MTHLIKIGNSQGIRIPKPLVDQAQLEGRELKLRILKDGILIQPEKGVRAGWEKAIEQSLQEEGSEIIDKEWLESTLVMDDELEW